MGFPTINKSLLPAKAAYFFFFFSYSSVTPYIAVFMSSNGLNAEQTGYILGARLFAQFLSGPVWGGIADKTRKYKLFLLVQIVVSTILLFFAPWVPLLLPHETTMCLGPTSVSRYSNSTTNGSLALKLSLSPTTETLFIVTNSKGKSFENLNVSRGENLKTKNRGTQAVMTKRISKNASEIGSRPLATTLQVNRTMSMDGKSKKCPYNSSIIFKIMMVLFTLVGTFDGAILLLVDNSVINTFKKTASSEFGKQRLWGAVGFGLASLASGVGIELSGSEGPNYFTMFYIFLGSNVCLLIASCFLKMPTADRNEEETNNTLKKPDRLRLLQGLAKTLKRFNVSFFLLTVLMMGMADNLLYSFMFLYIQDLNGSKIVMGLSVLVACCAEAVFFPFTDSVIKRLRGNLPSITVAFAMYSLRYLGFSLIPNAWYILPLQLLHSVCFALFWAATVYHTSSLAPKGMKATFLGIQNGIFFGIAGGTASIIGGIVYNHFGGKNLFRGYAGICGVWTVFLILHVLERKKKGKLAKKESKQVVENRELETDDISLTKRLFTEYKT